MEDHYQILGVPEDASEEQIKKRFRELAKIYHPDRGGDPEKFKQILRAYTTLSNKKSREEYDFWRKRWQTIFSYDFRNYDFKYKTSDYTSKYNEYSQKEYNYSKQEKSDSSTSNQKTKTATFDEVIFILVYFIFTIWLLTIFWPLSFLAMYAVDLAEQKYKKAKEIFYKLRNDKTKWENIKKTLYKVREVFLNIIVIGFILYAVYLFPIYLLILTPLFILYIFDKYKKK
jgi:curved DNA-binding protein CbpA